MLELTDRRCRPRALAAFYCRGCTWSIIARNSQPQRLACVLHDHAGGDGGLQPRSDLDYYLDEFVFRLQSRACPSPWTVGASSSGQRLCEQAIVAVEPRRSYRSTRIAELVDAGKTLHQALHYKMLGSPESSGYPASTFNRTVVIYYVSH